ncbi:MAG: HEAT repeat domain-containing protein [Myxococcales bacterium]|nr:HEAT repeat domain-containing protein [Myxococcales bacterium]
MSWLLPPLPPHFEAALRDVRARDRAARLAAAERLANPDAGREAEAEAGLLELADDRDARIRAAALQGLAELGGPAATERILQRLDDGHPEVRELAMALLAEIDRPEARRALREGLESPYPELRFQAVSGLAQRPEDDDGDALLALSDDPDSEVRRMVACALAGFGEQQAPRLRALLEDENAAVRRAAALSLSELGDAAGTAVLTEALDDPALTAAALEALGGLGNAGPHLERVAELAAARFGPLLLKAAAARCLLRLGDRRGLEPLRSVLRALRSDGRSYAVEVVAELRLGELVDELVRLADKPRGADPAALADALETLYSEPGHVGERAREGLAILTRRHPLESNRSDGA